MTRSIAITSSLIVSIIGGSAGAGRLIIIASVRNSPSYFFPRLDYIYINRTIQSGNVSNDILPMILSFELPFALIPLLKFSSSNTKMGPHKNSIYVREFYLILMLHMVDHLLRIKTKVVL